MTKAIVSVGSNLGTRSKNLAFAFDSLANISNTSILKKSSIYETEPIGPEQNDFLNAVVLLETQISPIDLLHALQDIENEAGRTRDLKWGPRTLDLDIVDFEGYKSDFTDLVIPHPQAVNRRFVLEPLFEIEPNWKINEVTVADLLDEVSEQRIELWNGFESE